MIDDGKAGASPAGHPETLVIHAGQQPDPGHGAVMEPIVMSSTFAQPEPGQPLRFDYSRSGNPTRAALEACLAALEHGRFGFAFGSGCAAGAVQMHTLRPGDQVVCGDDVYGGTYRLFNGVMRPLAIETITVDMRTPEAVAAALTDRTRLVWLETPTNPLLHLADIAAISALARARGVPVVVDNTFASPMLQNPLDLGATAVVHSTTKYINGHSDVVGGAIITSDAELAGRLKFLQNAIGAVPSPALLSGLRMFRHNATGAVPCPMYCYRVLRGVITRAVRLNRHVLTAS